MGGAEWGGGAILQEGVEQAENGTSEHCMRMASGRRTEEKESWWRGLSGAGRNHPRVLSPLLKFLMHALEPVRLEAEGRGGQGRASGRDCFILSSCPPRANPPSPPLQTVPSRPHLPRTYERLTFKILWRTPSFTPYPSRPPPKRKTVVEIEKWCSVKGLKTF